MPSLKFDGIGFREQKARLQLPVLLRQWEEVETLPRGAPITGGTSFRLSADLKLARLGNRRLLFDWLLVLVALLCQNFLDGAAEFVCWTSPRAWETLQASASSSLTAGPGCAVSQEVLRDAAGILGRSRFQRNRGLGLQPRLAERSLESATSGQSNFAGKR